MGVAGPGGVGVAVETAGVVGRTSVALGAHAARAIAATSNARAGTVVRLIPLPS